MNEWENVQRRIRELEMSFIDHYDFGSSSTSSSSAPEADYWKVRYEQEKRLWEEKSAAQVPQPPAVHEIQGMRELNSKINDLVSMFEKTKEMWKGRIDIQEVEDEFEKKKTNLDKRIDELFQENRKLKGQLDQLVDLNENEIKLRHEVENRKVTAEKEIDRLREKSENERLNSEKEVQTLHQKNQAVRNEAEKQIQEIETQKKELEKQINSLKSEQEKIKNEQLEKEKNWNTLEQKRRQRLYQINQTIDDQFKSFETVAKGFLHRVKSNAQIADGMLQKTLEESKVETELREQVHLAKKYAGEILKNMDTFASIAKVPQMELKPANPIHFISEIVSESIDASEEYGVHIIKELPQELPEVTADWGLLMNAFEEILKNAVEFSTEGEVVKVTARFDEDRQAVWIDISDTGCGIEESIQEKIFQPYFTTVKEKNGLGLSLAKKIIDLHHGSILLQSEKDKGTQVQVMIPIAPALE